MSYFTVHHCILTSLSAFGTCIWTLKYLWNISLNAGLLVIRGCSPKLWAFWIYFAFYIASVGRKHSVDALQVWKRSLECYQEARILLKGVHWTVLSCCSALCLQSSPLDYSWFISNSICLCTIKQVRRRHLTNAAFIEYVNLKS